MSRFGVLIVAVALSATFAAQTTRAQEPGQSDAKSIPTAPPIPWFDRSMAGAPDLARMLAISVATFPDCSPGSTAICYGLCAPSPDRGSDQANREQAIGRNSTPVKQPNAIKGKSRESGETGNGKTEN